jgi:hypothetical protein
MDRRVEGSRDGVMEEGKEGGRDDAGERECKGEVQGV